jgi:hypothetical protein
MLVTIYGESEITFAVTGRDIRCAGHKLAMIGRPYGHATAAAIIEALPSISKLHLRYRGVQIVFDIEVCQFDIDVEIRPSISKLYLQYRRLEKCFDIVKIYAISKVFDIRYDISITKSSISTLQDFDIECLQYMIRYAIM